MYGISHLYRQDAAHGREEGGGQAGKESSGRLWRSVRLGLGPRPLDHGLWWAVEEDEFGVEVLLQVELLHLPHQVDVQTQLQHVVHHWQLTEYDGQVLTSGGHAQEASDQQDEGHVQPDDSAHTDTEGICISMVNHKINSVVCIW